MRCSVFSCAVLALGLSQPVLAANFDCCPADYNRDGEVDGTDLGKLLEGWGTEDSSIDLNGTPGIDGCDLGQLLAAWGTCPLCVDLDVDTDRDGKVKDVSDEKDEDVWKEDRGAIFMVNADNDDLANDGGGVAGKNADAFEWGVAGPGGFEPEKIKIIDEKINNASDELDITPVVIRKIGVLGDDKVVKLYAASEEQIRAIQFFYAVKAGETKKWGGPGETKLEHDITEAVKGKGDVEMGFEGLKFRCVNAAGEFPAGHDMLFSGYIDLELRIEKKNEPTTVYGSDKVRLKVAPVMLLSNDLDAEELYVKDLGAANKSMRDDLKAVLGAKVKEYTTDTRWAQDDIEIGYTQTPRSSMHVTLFTRHHGSSENQELFPGSDPIGDATFRRQYLLDKDRGLYRSPSRKDVDTDSFDYGGNLELLPPTSKYPLGRICFGKGMSERKKQFLKSQEVQAPFDVDTDWLNVGHVDEMISFWKPASGSKNLTVILGSPKKAYSIIDAVGPDCGALPIAPPAERGRDGNAKGPVPLEDPGVVFGIGSYVAASVEDVSSESLTLDPSVPLSSSYQYLRIYEGPGMGQIAHIAAINQNQILIDQVWAPHDPTSFEVGLTERESVGLNGFWYEVPVKVGWFSPVDGFEMPGPGSKALLIEDTMFWPAPPQDGLAGLPGTSNPALVTVKELKCDFSKLRDINTLAQARIDDARAKIKAAAAPDVVTFVEVPVIYTGQIDATTMDLKDRLTMAWTPGAANIQFGGGKLFIAKQVAFKDGVDILGAGVSSGVDPGASGLVKYLEEFDAYHLNIGEVHCGTNVLRKVFGFDWWKNQPTP